MIGSVLAVHLQDQSANKHAVSPLLSSLQACPDAHAYPSLKRPAACWQRPAACKQQHAAVGADEQQCASHRHPTYHTCCQLARWQWHACCPHSSQLACRQLERARRRQLSLSLPSCRRCCRDCGSGRQARQARATSSQPPWMGRRAGDCPPAAPQPQRAGGAGRRGASRPREQRRLLNEHSTSKHVQQCQCVRL